MKYLILLSICMNIFLLSIYSNFAKADILTEPSPVPARSPVPRPSAAAQGYVKSAIPSIARYAVKNLKDIETTVLKLIQQNPDGLTPQQVFNSFGADQCQVYGFANTTMTFLNTIKAGMIPAWTISVTKAGVGAACTITVN